jgi:hypothetical protein
MPYGGHVFRRPLSEARCKVCDAEGEELLQHCPGYKLNEAAKAACLAGRVTSIETGQVIRYLREAGVASTPAVRREVLYSCNPDDGEED